MLQGELILVEDAGEVLLKSGECACFPKGTGNGHHLKNDSSSLAVYLEVGSRQPDDLTTCSDIDLMSSNRDGAFVHKDGTPYTQRPSQVPTRGPRTPRQARLLGQREAERESTGTTWARMSGISRRHMRTPALLLILAALGGCAADPRVADPASDAPEHGYAASTAAVRHGTYSEAITAWRGPEDVNAWIGSHFVYDVDRAAALSESQRAGKASPPIFEPSAFYARPSGVCVDLARFAVETLQRIAPEVKARYLMIEFDPLTLRGQVLRRHWVAIYDSPRGILVIADSKRPGFVAGPYSSVAEFIAEYAAFRRRDIVTYRELQTYQRKTKMLAKRRKEGV